MENRELFPKADPSKPGLGEDIEASKRNPGCLPLIMVVGFLVVGAAAFSLLGNGGDPEPAATGPGPNGGEGLTVDGGAKASASADGSHLDLTFDDEGNPVLPESGEGGLFAGVATIHVGDETYTFDLTQCAADEVTGGIRGNGLTEPARRYDSDLQYDNIELTFKISPEGHTNRYSPNTDAAHYIRVATRAFLDPDRRIDENDMPTPNWVAGGAPGAWGGDGMPEDVTRIDSWTLSEGHAEGQATFSQWDGQDRYNKTPAVTEPGSFEITCFA